jgi:prevent-host-death family protein
MTINFAGDIRPLSEMAADPLQLVKQARETGRPLIITNKGKADVVIMDATAFESRLRLANLTRLLAEAEDDVRAGRTVPASDLFAERRRTKKASR